MDLKDLLVHVDSGARAAERLELAIAIARRHGARLTGLFAESQTVGTSLVGRRDPAHVARAAREARTRFEARAAAAGLETRFWEVELGEYADVVGAAVVCCRYVDLSVFGQQHGDDAPVPDGLVERVIAGSGRPVLVVPSAGRYADAGGHVLVAWTGSREAARALDDALPLLARAAKVTVLSLQLATDEHRPGGLPPLDVVAHLAAHGVVARYVPTLLGDLDPVDVVLNRASDEGADLVVMGAYGVGGGGTFRRADTTQALLETMTTPVLLSS
jgi:nucleotide-binding universal stress UspA family protein